jgi:uncharacterized protein YjeT (DUF2065 family)
MSDFLAALGLVLIFEGILYGGFPSFAKRMVAQLLQLDDSALRIIGTAFVAIGFIVVWAVRG